MKSIKIKFVSVTAALMALYVQSASAQKAGDNLVTVGAAYLSFDSSVGTLTSNGSNPMEAAGFNAINNTLGTTSAKAVNTEVLTASVLHMYTDHWAAEAVIGIPPKVKVNIDVPGAAIAFAGTLPTTYNHGASATSWTPTVFAKYLLNDPGDSLRPYLGLGVSYVWFTNVKFEDATLLDTLSGGGAKLSSSWNPVATAGAIYNINENWSVLASAAYMPLKSNTTLTSGSGLTTTTGKLTLDPTIYNVSVGYKF